MRLSAEEIQFLIACVEETSIKGKDATRVSGLLKKMGKNFETQLKKESNGNLEKDINKKPSSK